MKLKPCPCGELDGVYLTEWTDQQEELSTDIAQVRCPCGFSGPECYGDNASPDATDRWNRRDYPDLRKLVEEMHRVPNKQNLYWACKIEKLIRR